MTGHVTSRLPVARIVLSVTVALSGLSLVTGLGVAAPATAETAQSDAIIDGDSVSCEGCICPQGLADKLGAECIQLGGEVAGASPDVTAAESPSCINCVPECAEQVVESRGKDLDCPA